MSTPTILNVDDNDASRYTISRILKLAGFEVQEAANATTALALAAKTPPEIILLDVNLPDLNGFDVCRQIKSDPATANVPVLMMSASFIREKDRVRGLDGGADGYLTGPLEPEVLIATVNALLRLRKAEEAVQVSGRKWQATFDAIGDGIALLNSSGVIEQCNHGMERIAQLEQSEIIGKHCSDVLGIAAGDQEHDPCRTVMTTGRRESADFALGERWLHMDSDPIFDADGRVTGCVCIVSDVTERQLAQQELQSAKDAAENASSAKDQFLAVLSHELRTPLTPVVTAVQALLDEPGLSEIVKMYLDVIHRNVELEARLIDDLLDLTKIARGKVQLNITKVNVHPLLESVVEICQGEILEKGMETSVHLDAGNDQVLADPARLQQVFWNLIKNSVKFTPKEGSVEIRTSNRKDGSLEIAVIDNGIGIEAHIIPHIFEAFEQGEQSITRRFGGLGLGLAISRTLMSLQGGTLEASSGGKNQGASFTVSIPTIERPASAQSGAEGRDAKVNGDEPLQILLVDDHVDTSRVMQLLLERRGYKVSTAHNVQSALASARERVYDLLISDIGLPDGSGHELMQELRKEREITGIALSGFGMEEDIQKSMEAGFSDHLTKPVGFNKLHEVIQRLTGRG